VPDAGGVEGRDGLDGVADGEVRGAPDQIDGDEREDDGEAMRAGDRGRGNRRGGVFEENGARCRGHAVFVEECNWRGRSDLAPKWISLVELTGEKKSARNASPVT
jgi:hypothetical protein